MCMCACKSVHFVLFTYLAFIEFYFWYFMHCVGLCVISLLGVVFPLHYKAQWVQRSSGNNTVEKCFSFVCLFFMPWTVNLLTFTRKCALLTQLPSGHTFPVDVWATTECICILYFVLCTLCCPNGNDTHGKFGSLSLRKASCNRVALPNPNF